jgi:hypothetical protein
MGDWRSFRFTLSHSGGVQNGDLLLVQETVGQVFIGDIALDSHGCKVEPQHLDFGDECVLIYHADKTIVEKQVGSGQVFLPGDKVYWSGTHGDGVTPIYASGLYWIGIATEPADADDDEVEIDLLGNKATLLE